MAIIAISTSAEHTTLTHLEELPHMMHGMQAVKRFRDARSRAYARIRTHTHINNDTGWYARSPGKYFKRLLKSPARASRASVYTERPSTLLIIIIPQTATQCVCVSPRVCGPTTCHRDFTQLCNRNIMLRVRAALDPPAYNYVRMAVYPRECVRVSTSPHARFDTYVSSIALPV